MLSWIATPGSASVHVDLMQAQVPDATTLAKFRHSLKAAGITAWGGSMVNVTFTWALKLNEEQGPRTTLKAHQSKKGEPGVSDTRRISAWMPQVALCML